MTVSVIIPTLNEEHCLQDTLQQLRKHHPYEILVVDGGSTDDTCKFAESADGVLHTAPGRALQMNTGALHARGEYLLFLHADCVLEDGALQAAIRCLKHERTVAGCFQMVVRATAPVYWFIGACATARVRLTGLIYGDQGLFVSRRVFQQVGGFPPLQLMEDIYISKLIRRLGRIAVVPRRIYVSPRRWQQVGVVQQTLRNWTLTALAFGGIHPDRLAAFYPPVR